MREPAVYIMASQRNGTLYTGVTSDLARRVFEHRTKAKGGFSARYNCIYLVWYEGYARIDEAIAREKQIKAGSRQKNLDLINHLNPAWNDLYEEI